MKNLTLRQLRYFEALSKHGHFGQAADACSVSQPALSVQIKELETGLGTALFERGARRVQLTPFGIAFGERVREILRGVDELGALARAAQGGLSGKIRIGVIPTIAPYLLPAILSNLARTHDALEVQIRETLTPRLIEELADGRIDTAIIALPVSEPAFTELPLFHEDMILVRPEVDASTPVPSAEALPQMRLLLLEEGHCFRDQALSFCNVPTARPRDGLDGSSLSTLVQMVGAGLGITLIPEMAVHVETRAAAVCVNHFPDPAPSRTIGMIWRKTNPLTAQLRQIGEIVRQAGKGREIA